MDFGDEMGGKLMSAGEGWARRVLGGLAAEWLRRNVWPAVLHGRAAQGWQDGPTPWRNPELWGDEVTELQADMLARQVEAGRLSQEAADLAATKGAAHALLNTVDGLYEFIPGLDDPMDPRAPEDAREAWLAYHPEDAGREPWEDMAHEPFAREPQADGRQADGRRQAREEGAPAAQAGGAPGAPEPQADAREGAPQARGGQAAARGRQRRPSRPKEWGGPTPWRNPKLWGDEVTDLQAVSIAAEVGANRLSEEVARLAGTKGAAHAALNSVEGRYEFIPGLDDPMDPRAPEDAREAWLAYHPEDAGREPWEDMAHEPFAREAPAAAGEATVLAVEFPCLASAEEAAAELASRGCKTALREAGEGRWLLACDLPSGDARALARDMVGELAAQAGAQMDLDETRYASAAADLAAGAAEAGPAGPLALARDRG